MMRPSGSEEEMKQIALNSLSKHLQIDALPHSVSIKCVKEAIPQYEVGHSTLIASIKSPSKHFTFLGSSFYGVAVNDCIDSINRFGLNLE
jgi:oxygen-dependent protoporphyrinogen oxidase